MKKISHSEITTYTDCQKKWELEYKKGLRISSPHLTFGAMAHKVMETGVIPDEELYPELKEFFKIKSWKNYFTVILNEIDNFIETEYEILDKELKLENDVLVGVIDLVLKNKKTNKILLMDYKFSNGIKDQEDLLLDEQLFIYVALYAYNYKVPIDDISVGFISIPKCELDEPRILRNGSLSKDKNQKVTYDTYLNKIKELGLNPDNYSDILSELYDREFVKIEINEQLNLDMLKRIDENINNIIKDMEKGYVIEKCTYLCKHCPHLKYCKYEKEILK